MAMNPAREAEELVRAGQELERQNDAGGASEAYARAQSIDPTFATAILREGVLRYRRGDIAGARILLARYADREPGNPEALCYLALSENDPERRAAYAKAARALDDARGTWSAVLREAMGSPGQAGR